MGFRRDPGIPDGHVERRIVRRSTARGPGLTSYREDLKPHLATGFPWHFPERDHLELDTPRKWWNALNPVFERAFLAVGVEAPLAHWLADMVRETYIDTRYWRVFGDVAPALDELSARKWTHLVLSNHVPELPQIVNGLDLGNYIRQIFSSAVIGYEKPNPRAFERVLQFTQGASAVWTVGDNMRSDIMGAETVGIPAILVRNPHEDARRYCRDLMELMEILY